MSAEWASRLPLRVLASLYCLGFVCLAADAPQSSNGAAKGPRIEVVLLDGRAPILGLLVNAGSGELSVQMENGETRREQLAGVKAVKFLPPLVVAKSGPLPLSEAEMRRLKELNDRDESGKLRAAEVDEMYKLRERAPLLEGELQTRRTEAALSKTMLEARKGRLDRHITLLQHKLKQARNEDEARDALLMLAIAYTQQAHGIPKARELLQKDMDAITDADVRQKVVDEMTLIFDLLSIFRPPARK